MENSEDIFQNGANGKFSKDKDKENKDKSKDYYRDDFKGINKYLLIKLNINKHY